MVYQYHRTVTSSLHAIARLASSSPYYVLINAPLPKALEIASRQVKRYPTIQASAHVRSSLRSVGQPVVQMLILKPTATHVPILLVSNKVPENSRETWSHMFDLEAPNQPLRWRNYQIAHIDDEARRGVTWRLSEPVFRHYHFRLKRLIAGRGGTVGGAGKRPLPSSHLSSDSAWQQVSELAKHLQIYPGFSGIRDDVRNLRAISNRLWRGSYPNYTYPRWQLPPETYRRAHKLARLETLVGANGANQPDPASP